MFGIIWSQGLEEFIVMQLVRFLVAEFFFFLFFSSVHCQPPWEHAGVLKQKVTVLRDLVFIEVQGWPSCIPLFGDYEPNLYQYSGIFFLNWKMYFGSFNSRQLCSCANHKIEPQRDHSKRAQTNYFFYLHVHVWQIKLM